jgi:adenylate cyclase
MPHRYSDLWRSLAKTLLGAPEFTPAEVAAEAGVDLQQARRLWRALGFPAVPDDDRIFTRTDVAMLGAAAGLLEQEGAEPEVLLQLTRVTGQALARVAEAQVAAAADRLGDLLRAADTAEPAAIDEIVTLTETMVDTLNPFLSYAWRRHLLAAVWRAAAAGGGQESADHVLIVGFADLVGFTAISQQLEERELAGVVDRFEALAYAHIPARGGRVVKMIGDEVMFVVEDAIDAAEIALALVEAYAGDDAVPDIRVGLAMGPTLSWGGDLFGPTVNLASRLVNVARPATVLVSNELGTRLLGEPRFVLRNLRPLALQGIGRVTAWVVRRPPDKQSEA